MANFSKSNFGGSPEGSEGGFSRPPRLKRSMFAGGAPTAVAFAMMVVVIYLGYFWFVRRIVVGPGQVLLVMRKDGARSLPADQIIIPRAPDPKDAAAYAQWNQTY